MDPKQVFTGAGFKRPLPLSMSIPEAPYGRVSTCALFEGTRYNPNLDQL